MRQIDKPSSRRATRALLAAPNAFNSPSVFVPLEIKLFPPPTTLTPRQTLSAADAANELRANGETSGLIKSLVSRDRHN